MAHTRLAIDHAYERYSEPGYWSMEFKRFILVAVLFHDIGKPKTYTENSKGIHNYGHEAESAKIVRRILADEPECEEIATYVGLHMEMHKMITHKDYMERLAKMYYELKLDGLHRLLLIHECDVYGSKCEDPEMKKDDIERFKFLKKVIRMLSTNLTQADKKFIFKENGKR